MSIQSAKQLLRQYCQPVNWFDLIMELAAERNIPERDIWFLIDSGEYGVGKNHGIWMVRKSRLFVPEIPRDKLGIDKDTLLHAIDPIQVFSNELSVELKDQRWQSVLCPFHEEHNPSFRILLPDGGYICRSCDERGGNVINFVMALHHLNFPTAIDYLAKHYTRLAL